MTYPGDMVLTRIPSAASSWARLRANDQTKPFEPAYPDRRCPGETCWDVWEQIMIILPFMLCCFILLVTCCTAQNVPASYARFSQCSFSWSSWWCFAYINQLQSSNVFPGMVEERFIYTDSRCSNTGWMTMYISCFLIQCDDYTYMPSTRRKLWKIWSKDWFNCSCFVRSQLLPVSDAALFFIFCWPVHTDSRRGGQAFDFVL